MRLVVNSTLIWGLHSPSPSSLRSTQETATRRQYRGSVSTLSRHAEAVDSSLSLPARLSVYSSLPVELLPIGRDVDEYDEEDDEDIW